MKNEENEPNDPKHNQLSARLGTWSRRERNSYCAFAGHTDTLTSKQGVLRIVARRYRMSKRIRCWDITYDHVCRLKLAEEDHEEYQWFILKALTALSPEIGTAFAAWLPRADGSTWLLWLFRPDREPRQTNDRIPPPGETSVSFLTKEEY